MKTTENTIQRLHTIFRIMKSADRAFIADVFAQRLGVTTKTIARDMERLRDFGVDIISNRNGGNENGYRLAENSPCPFCGGAFK